LGLPDYTRLCEWMEAWQVVDRRAVHLGTEDLRSHNLVEGAAADIHHCTWAEELVVGTHRAVVEVTVEGIAHSLEEGTAAAEVD